MCRDDRRPRCANKKARVAVVTAARAGPNQRWVIGRGSDRRPSPRDLSASGRSRWGPCACSRGRRRRPRNLRRRVLEVLRRLVAVGVPVGRIPVPVRTDMAEVTVASMRPEGQPGPRRSPAAGRCRWGSCRSRRARHPRGRWCARRRRGRRRSGPVRPGGTGRGARSRSAGWRRSGAGDGRRAAARHGAAARAQIVTDMAERVVMRSPPSGLVKSSRTGCGVSRSALADTRPDIRRQSLADGSAAHHRYRQAPASKSAQSAENVLTASRRVPAARRSDSVHHLRLSFSARRSRAPDAKRLRPRYVFVADPV